MNVHEIRIATDEELIRRQEELLIAKYPHDEDEAELTEINLEMESRQRIEDDDWDEEEE